MVARSSSAASTQAEVEYEVSYLKMLSERRASGVVERPPLSMSCCRWSVGDVRMAAELIGDASPYAKHWQQMRQNAQRAPCGPFRCSMRFAEGLRSQDKGQLSCEAWLVVSGMLVQGGV